MSKHSVATQCWAIAICAILAAVPVAAEVDFRDMASRIVRVEVKTSGKDRVGSGFIWQRSDQVVTSLHSVLDSREIWVQCKQHRQKATVQSVHQAADLVLLKTAPFPSNCKPFESVDTSKPRDNQKLHTLGFYGAAIAESSRQFVKAYAAPPETIARIVGGNGNVVNDLRELGTPSVDLEIYHVQGGLLPGYSGAPVVDDNGRLIGVVDGGLNGGTTDYNWAIPGKHLNELASMGPPSQMPSAGGNASASLFSYGVDASETNAVIAYTADDWDYQWVKTKTVSLAEVLRYTDTLDLNAVRALLNDNASVFGPNAEARLRFDVYEDIDNGLVIAIPVGHALDIEDGWLVSYAPPDGQAGSIRFQMLPWGLELGSIPQAPEYDPETGGFVSVASVTEMVMPTDPDYFDVLIETVFNECNVEGESSCDVVDGSREDYEYPGANKVLNIAFDVQEADNPAHYEHYSFAVRGFDDIAFQSYARIEWAPNDIYTCTEDPSIEGCYNSQTAFINLQQILAVSLSSTSRYITPQAPMDLSAQ